MPQDVPISTAVHLGQVHSKGRIQHPKNILPAGWEKPQPWISAWSQNFSSTNFKEPLRLYSLAAGNWLFFFDFQMM